MLLKSCKNPEPLISEHSYGHLFNGKPVHTHIWFAIFVGTLH